MAKAGGPSSEQLLELLKRAADELKASRDEVTRAQKELNGERKRREEAEATAIQERTVGGQHPKVRAQLDELQELYQQAKVTLEQTRGELQHSRENLVNEVAAQREMKSAIEREANAHSQTRAALEAEQAAHLQARGELERERQGIEEQLAARQADGHAATQQLQLELEHARAELANERQRLAEHTEELATALSERDAGAARIEAIEAARKTDREIEDAKVKELEDKLALETTRSQQQAAEAGAAFQQEKEKHQAMAQKFLGEKQKARELEAALQEAKARVGELESATVAAAEQHAKELTERQEQWQQAEKKWQRQGAEREAAWKAAEAGWLKVRAQLEANLAPLQAQVETSAQERFYVERKYEELSRELQLTLEQRDEVRRLLDNVQAERQRLERALQQR